MAFWYFDKDELHRTASAQDGIPHERESRYRQEGARFIIDAGTKMDLGYNTMATGVVYFHRFYMYHSFKTFPRYVSNVQLNLPTFLFYFRYLNTRLELKNNTDYTSHLLLVDFK